MSQQSPQQQLSGQSQGGQHVPLPRPQAPSISHRCHLCGAEIRPNESFCPNCGARLAPVPQLPVQNPYAEARTQQAARPNQDAIPGRQGIPSLEVEIQSTIHGEKHTYDLTKPVINIGRDPSNDIVIDAPMVSSFHAQIVREGNQLILIHPHPSRSHTTNGLLYQGRHILGNEPFRKPLVRGDIFRIGGERGALVTLTYNDGSGVPQETVPEVRPLPVGAPVSTLGSQSLHPQAQLQEGQQALLPSQYAQPSGQPGGRQQVPLRSQKPHTKKSRTVSKEVKIAFITTLGTILVATITYILAPVIINAFTHNPAPTATARPTTAPTPSSPSPTSATYPPPGWQPTYSDPMKSNISGYWPERTDSNGATCSFTGNVYQVTATTKSGSEDCITSHYNLTDFALEVQMTIVKGDEAAIDLRSADDGGGSTYYFWISEAGTYGFEIYENSHLYKVLKAGSSPALNTVYNQTNLIAVVAQGNTFRLYVAKQLIATVHDQENSYSRGYIGFGVFSIDNLTQALFSNLMIWTPNS